MTTCQVCLRGSTFAAAAALMLALNGLGSPAQAQAASAAKPAANAAANAAAPNAAEEMAESARRSVRASAEWLARGVDSWFGDRPFEDGGKVSDGELRLRVFKRQDQDVDIDLRFDARFALPNIDKSTYLFIGRDEERNIVRDQPGALQRQQELPATRSSLDGSFFAGLGRLVNDEIDLRVGFRGGLKPYVQARYRKPWTLGPVTRAEFRESIFYSSDDKLGSTTAFSIEHRLSPVLNSRWISVATITQKSEKFEWFSNLGMFRSFGAQKQLSLELLTNGAQGSGVLLTDYGVQSRWEQPIYKDWLIGEVLLGHFWPRPDRDSARGRAWAVSVGLKMRI